MVSLRGPLAGSRNKVNFWHWIIFANVQCLMNLAPLGPLDVIGDGPRANIPGKGTGDGGVRAFAVAQSLALKDLRRTSLTTSKMEEMSKNRHRL